jgi:hypothetical protein
MPKEWFRIKKKSAYALPAELALHCGTKALGIEISGLHRSRANFAQNKFQDYPAQSIEKRKAPNRVLELLGHPSEDVPMHTFRRGLRRLAIIPMRLDIINP